MAIYNIDELFFPILLATKDNPSRAVDFTGTGFFIAPDVLMTCWHCLSTTPGSEFEYVIRVRVAEQQFICFPLENIQRDERGMDLATATVRANIPTLLSLSDNAPFSGQNVWAFGFPHHDAQNTQNGKVLTINGRFFKSYIMRSFYHQPPACPQTLCYELGMPAPLGLSGAPLLIEDSLNVVGVIYGGHDIETITEFSSVDPDTGKREPEVRRITSLAIAYNLDTISSVTTAATQGKTLREFLSRDQPR